MENMLAQPAQDLETPRSSTKIVSKVLSQTSAASTFLKNAGIETPVSKYAASATREAQLREQVQAEKQWADLLQEELDCLKKKAEEIEESMAKTQEEVRKAQQEMEDFKKKQEANDLLLQRILNLNLGNRATQLAPVQLGFLGVPWSAAEQWSGGAVGPHNKLLNLVYQLCCL